ncbi:MAG: right-handed parallel beta-helix repeat-containing protein, partial [Kiritimatiellia bacterium]|nr:right-handed parallel beta-helix repeat-containing protein [Kiritimatiellia bacterium]
MKSSRILRAVLPLMWMAMVHGFHATIASGMTSYYVSPSGSLSNPGTESQPFLTLEQARDQIRTLKNGAGLPVRGVTVYLREGTYERASTFALSALDSGEPGKPIIYRAYPGETVRITSARSLSPSSFSLVTPDSPVWTRLHDSARGHVQQIDLVGAGIENYGVMRPAGFGGTAGLLATNTMELFQNQKRMTLARWPDIGENVGAQGITNGFAYFEPTDSNGAFSYTGNRPERWASAEEIWFHGFWGNTWSDSYAKGTINTALKRVTLATTNSYGITAQDGRYYAVNLLEEITVPGEWYVNRSTGILYFWPLENLAGSNIEVSMLETPIIQLTGASRIKLQDLTIEMARRFLVEATGADEVVLENCELRNAGNYAVSMTTSTNSGLRGCTIRDVGAGGVRIGGGNRATLTASGNFVESCQIRRFSQWLFTYVPGIGLVDGSVGIRIAHNRLQDSPHTAILLAGRCNDITVEYNEVYDVLQLASDAGAIYIGRDLGARGNVIRYNLVRDIWTSAPQGYGVHGIYLDDGISGIHVHGNILYHISDYGIQHGGGRDILMTNNVMVSCGVGMRADARGAQGQWYYNSGGSSNLWWNLQSLPYQTAPWSTRWPECAAIPNTWEAAKTWIVPAGSVFKGNFGSDNELFYWASGNAFSYYSVAPADGDNRTATDPMFMDEAGLDFRLHPNSEAFLIPGFKSI